MKLHDAQSKQLLSKITQKIHSLRSLQGLTQRTLGQKAKIAHITIAKVENGEYYYSLPTLLRLCKALNITLSELFAEIERI